MQVVISSSSLSRPPSLSATRSWLIRSSRRSARRARAYERMKSANSRDASAALSSIARVTPNWYMATMRCDQSSSCAPMVLGTPSRSAMTATGIGVANSARRSASPSRKSVDPLMRERGNRRRELFDLTRDEGAVDKGAKPRVLRRLKLEDGVALQRVEGREMRLGLRPAECSRLITCRICRPKRRSRSSADTSAWRAKHQKP